MIRVGRTIYKKGTSQRVDPHYDGFTNVIVLLKNTSEWGPLSPFELKDEQQRIMENVWQFSKVYQKVPKTTQKLHRYSDLVIWDHPAETHLANDGTLTPAHLAWRQKGMNAKYAIRYPVGWHHRHKCLYALAETDLMTPLNYIESRKAIYVYEYCRLVKRQPKFVELQQRLKAGENLLIIEVDGPHQESLEYYKTKYGVDDTFIQNDTMLTTEQNIQIMLNDGKHPFGHGYCLAMALLDKEVEWNK